MPDYYEILELPRDATQEQIRSHYHKLALKYHPDKAGPDGVAKFKEIHKAYEILSSLTLRQIYDRYGAAAADNFAANADSPLQPNIKVLNCLIFVLFLILSMMAVFMGFIAAFVDGKLVALDSNSNNNNSNNNSYWNYVKVFSPLFVADILLFIPTVILLVISIWCRKLSPILISLTLLSLFALSIVIPIIKDSNDKKVFRGEENFHSWRITLTPLYLAVIFFTFSTTFSSLPTSKKRERYFSTETTPLWEYTKVSFIFSVVRGICLGVFSALIALRADNIITINYFIVIGLPFYVLGASILVELLCVRIFIAKAYHTQLTFFSLCGPLILSFIVIGLILASVSMISMRLNDLNNISTSSSSSNNNNNNNNDITELTYALIPLFILLAPPWFVLLGVVCYNACCCGGVDIPVENYNENENEMHEEVEEQREVNNKENEENNKENEREEVVFSRELPRRLSDID